MTVQNAPGPRGVPSELGEDLVFKAASGHSRLARVPHPLGSASLPLWSPVGLRGAKWGSRKTTREAPRRHLPLCFAPNLISSLDTTEDYKIASVAHALVESDIGRQHRPRVAKNRQRRCESRSDFATMNKTKSEFAAKHNQEQSKVVIVRTCTSTGSAQQIYQHR